MSRKLTNSGLAVTGIGAVAAVIGLILFISVFFAVGRQINSPFGPGFGHHQPFPFSRAVVDSNVRYWRAAGQGRIEHDCSGQFG